MRRVGPYQQRPLDRVLREVHCHRRHRQLPRPFHIRVEEHGASQGDGVVVVRPCGGHEFVLVARVHTRGELFQDLPLPYVRTHAARRTRLRVSPQAVAHQLSPEYHLQHHGRAMLLVIYLRPPCALLLNNGDAQFLTCLLANAILARGLVGLRQRLNCGVVEDKQ